MPKKCIICEDGAVFAIKDTNDYYCKDCAEEQFDDVSYLVKIEEENKVKNAIETLEEYPELLKEE